LRSLILLLVVQACSPDAAIHQATCRPTDRSPYPASSPYLGVHAGPQQNDLVACDLADAYEPAWHALEGYGVAQPNTFSPDGQTTYVTTSEPTPDACTVFALDVATGETRWCVRLPGALGAAVSVDEDGDLYLSAAGAVRSLDADGATRWSHDVVDALGAPSLAYGTQFTPDGLVATVTADGALLLLDRATGAARATLDLPSAFGFPKPDAASAPLDLGSLLPESISADLARVFGGAGQLLSVFTGSSGNYTDNTVGIAPDGTLYVIGYGPDAHTGALVQVKRGGPTDAPSLTPGWFVRTVEGSASSPSISPDGRWVKVTDGNVAAAVLNPANAVASARLVDIGACDQNTDSDADPTVCAASVVVPLVSGPALGASPVLNDGEQYLWDVQLADLLETTHADLRRLDGDQVVWATRLPDDAQWTSVVTLTDRHILGTTTRLTASDQALLSIELPATASSDVVMIDRATGELVWSAPVTDDSASTVTVGQDGSLYVTLLGLVHGFATDTPIVGGVQRFVEPADRAEPE
jgi:hypothetical protein